MPSTLSHAIASPSSPSAMDSTTSNETKAGPYTVNVFTKMKGRDYWYVAGPGIETAMMNKAQAELICHHFNAAFAAGQASREQWRPVPKKLGEFKFMSTETVLTYDPTKPKGERIRQRGTYVGEWSKTVTHYCELPKEPNP